MTANQAERGLALMRIVIGFWLLQAALGRMAWMPWPEAAASHMQAVTIQLAEISLGHPQGWVRWLVQEFLLPQVHWHVNVMLALQFLGGLSLTLGLLTVPGAFAVLLLAVIEGVLVYPQGTFPLGYHLLLGMTALVFMAARTGRRWGLDTLLAGIRERSLLW